MVLLLELVVIVAKLHLQRVAILPDKPYSVLICYPDGVILTPLAFHFLQPIAGWNL